MNHHKGKSFILSSHNNNKKKMFRLALSLSLSPFYTFTQKHIKKITIIIIIKLANYS